ncbi:MAG: DUF4124 domain-containing protein [Gammaproteobacteria bacterium]|nr:DUF4124 domain-containing protein [Gammaproteobacteria bacterium]
MIRILTAGLLLTIATSLLAQPLYRWVEADGSITFSPSKPTDGRDYEVVNPAVSQQGAGTIAPEAAKLSAAEQSTTSESRLVNSAALSPVSPTENSLSKEDIVARSVVKKPTQGKTDIGKLSYAPSTNPDTPRLRDGITAQTAAAEPAISPKGAVQPQGKSNMVASKQKFAQCQELRKRVVSLERQIKTGLTPERMDSTVVYMARYQRSINQHCG